MTQLPLQTINLVGLGVVMSLFLVAVWVYIKITELINGVDRDQREANKKAWAKSEEIINEARGQATKIISAATLDAETERKVMKERLDEISASHLRRFEEMLQKISNTVQTGTDIEIKRFADAMTLETVGAQKTVAARIEKLYDDTVAEIGEYKKTQMKMVDQDMAKIVGRVARETLGKTIKIDDHMELIKEALEKAKKDEVI